MLKEKIFGMPVVWEAIGLIVLLLTSSIALLWYGVANNLPIQANPGYRLSLFVSGNASYRSPDGLAVDQRHVFLDYQNDTAKDGSDHRTSTVVEYDMNGQALKTFSVSGHSDGLRIDPATHLVWALSNEVSNPGLTIIDPANCNSTEYKFPPTAHGGGYDDLYFLDGERYPFLSASNPQVDKNGRNNHPSVYQITNLVKGNPGHADVKPILLGDAPAVDRVTKATISLNEVDPDALSMDLQEELVLVNQTGSELVFLSDPGTAQQKVSRLGFGTQIDDTVWISSAHGRLLIADAARNQTYWMEAVFKPGTVYTETYPDSSIQSVVGQLDPDTGVLTVVATGFLKPTGMVFVPD